MSGLEGALCVGQHELFESIVLADHMEAKRCCIRCPAFDACEVLLAEVLDPGPGGAYRGVQGTWAGRLFGQAGYPRPTVRGRA